MPSNTLITSFAIGILSITPSLNAENIDSNADQNIYLGKEGLTKLETAAAAAGWRTERSQDGSLRLYPNKEKQTTRAVTDIIRTEELDQLEASLSSRGWGTQRNDQGHLLLFPPGSESNPPTPKHSTAATSEQTPSSDKPADDTLISTDNLEQLQGIAQQHGWETSMDQQGNLLLFIQSKQSGAGDKNKAFTLSFSNLDRCQFGSIPVNHPKPAILPVNKWKKAQKIAKLVINHTGNNNESLGKIREINELYIVSIVSKLPPHSLLRQLIIQKSDGKVISLP